MASLNSLNGLLPTFYAALAEIGREQLGFVGAVGRDVSADELGIGAVVSSPVTPVAVASDISSSNVHADEGGQVITTTNISLTKSRKVSIQWTGEEQKSYANVQGTIFMDQIKQALRTLSGEMEQDIAAAAVVGASRAYGTAGTTPFATANTLMDFAGVQRILDDNGVPQENRSIILSSASNMNLRGAHPELFKVNESGSEELLRNGNVSRVMGLDLRNSFYAPKNTAGTGAGFLVNVAGGLAAGATEITVDTGTGTILAGNVVTIGGEKYVVTAALAANKFSIGAPGLVAAVADNAPITMGAAYTANVVLHKRAVQLVTRLPAMPAGGDSAADVAVITDPVSGISFQIAMYKGYRQVHFEIGAVWGVKAINPSFAAILLG